MLVAVAVETDPDRIVLANAVGVSNTAGPHEIALTEAMVAPPVAYLLCFLVSRSVSRWNRLPVIR